MADFTDEEEFEEIEIMACISSEKGYGSLGFGVSGEAETVEDLGTDWLFEGIGDSWWENCSEFEDDVEAVRKACEENKDLSWADAITQVLGHFTISYEVNGVETDLHYDFDFEGIMTDYLRELKGT